MNKTFVIALAGNPNVGKTTLFNSLTGAHQSVGNWPGVTVEHKSGHYHFNGVSYKVIDLPGIYSLSALSPDERIARDFISNEKPDLIVNLVDASNLERNLYLSTQLMEMEVPMLMVLSMVDLATQNGIGIDYQHLATHLGFNVFPVVLNKRLNDQILKREIAEALSDPKIPARIHYDEIVEKGLDAIETLLSSKNDARARWISLKLIEGDIEVSQQISDETRPAVEKIVQGICKHRGQQGTAVIADDRFGYIRGLLKDVVRRRNVSQHTFSDRLDKITLNSILGLPVFFFVMYLVFLVAVRLSQPIIDLIDAGFSWLLVDGIPALLDRALVPQWLTFLLSEGLGGGITTIATFIPPIFFIFFSLSILEDSGYMARAAFIADKFMRRIGLPGKAFIPLLVGFGCTVPAIMATRTLESKRDRVFASLLTPFVSCGAKLPVYTFMGLMFFPDKADLVIFSLYLSGILMAMITGLLLKKTIFKTEPGDFVMELPPYHVPTYRGIFLHTWHRLKDFVLRAGKTILIAIILINVLQVVQIKDPFTPGEQKITILELGGKALNPLFRPMGIKEDNWQASVALVSGIFAKEAVVGTMQSLYTKEGAELKSTVTRAFGGWEAAYAYLLFVLLYSPCVAALTMLFKEHGRTWLFFSLIYLTILAWLIATLFYQISTFRIQSLLWIGFSALLGIAMYQYLKLIGRGSRNAFE